MQDGRAFGWIHPIAKCKGNMNLSNEIKLTPGPKRLDCRRQHKAIALTQGATTLTGDSAHYLTASALPKPATCTPSRTVAQSRYARQHIIASRGCPVVLLTWHPLGPGAVVRRCLKRRPVRRPRLGRSPTWTELETAGGQAHSSFSLCSRIRDGSSVQRLCQGRQHRRSRLGDRGQI